MDETYAAAVSLAALEVLPGEPSDLSKILRDEAARDALLALSSCRGAGELVAWMGEEIELARVETWHKRLDRIGRDLNVRAVLAHHADYPSALRHCWDAPPLLFVRGEVSQRPAVAVVGSRTADRPVIKAAHAVAAAAAYAGMSVVSGLAAGVDAAAHKGALEAGGHTAAIMGTGIERVFPEQNAELAERIVAQGGVLVSQFAPNAPRTSTTFLRRNAVIAGLARVDVVMTGVQRSGSHHQAEQAIRYRRPVLLWQPALGRHAWALEAVESGAAAFFDDPTDVTRLARRGHDRQ